MKKQSGFLLFIMTCIILLTMTACGHKSYATLEEWYADNPSKKLDELNFSEGGTKASVGISIEGNVIVYKMNLGTKTIGRGDMMDKVFTAVFDSAFADDKSNNDKVIKQLSSDSGIDASLISIRYEIYNPGESTPCYTKTYPEQ